MEDLQTKGAVNALLEDIYQTHTKETSGKIPQNRDFKILFFVIIFGFFGIAFGLWRMSNIIQKPAHILTAGDIKGSYSLSDINEELAIFSSDVSLKDTDGDGVNDYDEANIYATSPYLEDTDSDGVSDYDEIQKGTLPNCLGGNCNANIPESSQEANALNQQSAGPVGEITASYLRSLLEKSGIESATLQTLSDEEILDVYYSAIAPQDKKEAAPMPAQGAQESSSIQKMPPKELRDFLKKSGMPQEMLDKFSDEEILQVLQETINQ